MIVKMKGYLRENRYTKKMYLYLAFQKSKIQFRNTRKAMQKNGLHVIEKIAELLNNGEIHYFFDFGTLLGIIRENKILEHDLDIDIGVYHEKHIYKKVRSILSNAGFKIVYEYMIDNTIVEESYVFYDIKIDINYYFNDEDKSKCYLFYRIPEKKYNGDVLDAVELVCDRINIFKGYDFNGVLINVPENPEHLLEQRYGPNWKVPDKNWVYWKGPSAKPYEKQGIRVTY